MAFASGAPDPTRAREAERLGELILPDMLFEDRLKVADIALSEYGRVMAGEVPPAHGEEVRIGISKKLRVLANEGEQWAARALTAYCCKVCFDALADKYSAEGHRKVCGVTCYEPAEGGRVFHRAARVQHYGGSWSLNVYAAACGVTNLTNGNRGSAPCSDCFR